MQQHGSKYFALRPPPNPRNRVYRSNSIFQSTVMLHIKLKVITKCSNIVANILPADPPPHLHIIPTTLGYGVKVKFQLFQMMVMLHIKLKGITNAGTWSQLFCLPPPPPPPPGNGVNRSKVNFFQKMVILHFKSKGTTTYSNKVANILHADPRPDPRDQKV